MKNLAIYKDYSPAKVKKMQRTIGCDFGYNGLKVAVFNDNMKKVKSFCPAALSVVGNAKTGSYDKGVYYEYKGKSYKVGKKALRKHLETRGDDFLIEYAPLFLAYFFETSGLNPDDYDYISTGLSVLDWEREVDLKAALKAFTVNGKRYRFKEVIVSPQGRGILYDLNLENLVDVFIIDGGFNTLDLIHFEDGELEMDNSDADLFGISKMIHGIKDDVQRITGNEYPILEVNEMVKAGFYRFNGANKDIASIKKPHCDEYISELKMKLKTDMKAHIARAEKVVFGGGLAHIMKDEKMPKHFTFGDEYSNASGYLDIAGEEL